jgi:cold shock CspA family protein
MIGKIRTLWVERRYGFATRQDNHRDAFVHLDNVEITSDPPQAGSWIEFDLAKRPDSDKEYAVNIRVIPAPGGAA